MDQRPGLIKERRGKGNAKFNRRDRKPLFKHRTFGVKCLNRGTSGAIITGFQDIVGQFPQHIVFDNHVIGRRIAIISAVIIGHAHIQRIAPDSHCDFINDAFNRDHPLWPTKTAKGRVGHKVGFAAIGPDFNITQIIGIVGMEHRTVGNRGG